ncbi:MAG: Fe2+-dependent dioxygenase [Pseudomonadales bacterium]|nr:Fe2+-dependent dioxygenase [Pseudomonadales bacterium]
MLLVIEGVLDSADVRHFRDALVSVTWRDGRDTTGGIARHAKHNRQASDAEPSVRALGDHLAARLLAHPEFVSAALPKRIHPVRFNRYARAQHYGLHIDAAVMRLPQTGEPLRSDVSCTVFLCDPDDYEGGELLIETPFGTQAVKLPAGDAVVYPASSLHRVTPVTAGERLAGILWLQSLVRSAERRSLLFDLDNSVRDLVDRLGEADAQVLRLSGVYHNLLREWAEV